MDDEDVIAIPGCPNEFQTKAIPPEVLTLFRLRHEMTITW
jgi:hypothetical protein